jgi:hypothetical protein
MSGLSLDELWMGYLEIGGSRSRGELAERLADGSWPASEDRYLAVVADEALRECGLPRLIPLDAATDPLRGDDPPADVRWSPRRTAAAVLEVRARGTRLTALFEECARARADARGSREHARAVRRAFRS